MLDLAQKLGLDQTTLDTIAYIIEHGDKRDKAVIAIELVRMHLTCKNSEVFL